MLRLLRNRKGQNAAEYALLFAVVIGVFSAMQIYTRRALQARIKAGTDNIPSTIIAQAQGDDKSGTLTNIFGTDTQYEPYYLKYGSYSSTGNSNDGRETGTVTHEGGVRELSGATNQRTGSQEVTSDEEAD